MHFTSIWVHFTPGTMPQVWPKILAHTDQCCPTEIEHKAHGNFKWSNSHITMVKPGEINFDDILFTTQGFTVLPFKHVITIKLNLLSFIFILLSLRDSAHLDSDQAHFACSHVACGYLYVGSTFEHQRAGHSMISRKKHKRRKAGCLMANLPLVLLLQG